MTFMNQFRFLWRNRQAMQVGMRGVTLCDGPRDTAAYHKAMKTYAAEHPVCEFCRKPGGKVEVHHIIPVSVDPTKAADITNMVTLHRKPDCHMVVGHLGNFRDYNKAVAHVCAVMASDEAKKTEDSHESA